MKTLITAAMAAALTIGSAGAALAQPYGHAYGHDRNDRGRYDNDRGRYDNDRGHYGWRSEWRRGHRIDHDNWRRASRVDWRRHHLRAPPRGYEWREIDGRYVLGAVATGLIADLIINGGR
jgi:Ni/Co efflux regulator RcnB